VSESTARLPSAVCGVLLVAAVYWLATLVSERRAVALGSAMLAALSPFVLEYSQRAQPYVFEMLAVTVAFAAALEAERATRRAGWWLGAAAAASVCALCLNYTGALAIGALCVWVAARRTMRRWWRGAFVGACIATAAAFVPLALAQHDAFPHRSGVAAVAGVSWTTVARTIEAPFDGRVDVLRILGVISMLAAVCVLLTRRRVLRAQGLLLAVAAGGPLTMFVLSAVGGGAFWGHLMLSRYVAFAVPVDVVLIAAAVRELEALRLGLGAVLSACVAVGALGGLIESHRAQGFYLDARGVASYVRTQGLGLGALISPGEAGVQLPLLYYGLRPDWVGSWQAAADVRRLADPLWVIYEVPASATAARLMRTIAPSVRRLGYRPQSARLFPGVVPLAVVRMSRIAPVPRLSPVPGLA
jgi:4-amino-4-deoxy-L-arabinose transferase-like glycosyltransferase